MTFFGKIYEEYLPQSVCTAKISENEYDEMENCEAVFWKGDK